MITFENFELWFITGSQHLYGSETLKQVVSNSKEIASYLDISSNIPIKVKTKRALTTPEEIQSICKSANASDTCVGLIIWMHTFSPAKMWINGLSILQKPMLHLHTQFNSHIPWDTIDMDYMNLNQSAHGGREFGFINMRLKTSRKVVVGYWKDPEVIEKIDVWARAAIGWADCQKMKIARIGDNMREVAVTEGNKVSAQIKFGYSVNGYGLGDIVEYVEAVSQSDIDHLIDIYLTEYNVAASLLENGNRHSELLEAAKIEIGLKSFLQNGGFTAFTDTFENLTGLGQLPGIAVQRIMAAGYGFAAEGDWKTAGLVRTMKVMAHGLNGGNSFMEDYTYHLDPDNMLVLGAHMLEICPSISAEKPQCEIHPLGIGGKNDPVRLIFNAAAGAALNASMIDTGSRFRLLMNTVEGMQVQQKLPQLPVARALWQPHPDLKTAATAWILAGGAHHTCYSQNLGKEHLEDFAAIAGIEYLTITEHTRLEYFKQTLRNNEVYYHFLNN